MTKTKNYKHYGYNFKAYSKPVGHGWEVGCYFEGKPVFVGNFIHKKEANQWWKEFNHQMKSFFAKYDFPTKGPHQWMTKFFSNYCYKAYYKFLDTAFSKYTREYNKAYQQDYKKYKKLKPRWDKAHGTKYAA